MLRSVVYSLLGESSRFCPKGFLCSSTAQGILDLGKKKLMVFSLTHTHSILYKILNSLQEIRDVSLYDYHTFYLIC